MAETLNLATIYGTPIFTLQTFSPAVKNVYGASFSGAAGLWRFPAFYPVHSIVLDDLKKEMPAVTLSPEVIQHAQALAQPLQLPSDFSFITPPYKHQVDGVMHLYRFMRAGLFYSPGLGKCKITVDLQRLTQSKMLIVCPLVMLSTWIEEFAKHGNVTDVVAIDGSKKEKLSRIAKAQERAPQAVIVTYNVASLYTNDLIRIGYNAIVADESHQLKTPFSNRTKAVTALSARAARRVLLSGTPSLGSPFDMYAQLRFLGTYFCSENWWAFRKMFGVFPDYEKDEKVPKIVLGFKNLDIINTRVNLVSIRRTKEECLDLPDQNIIDILFPLYADQKGDYNRLIQDKADAGGVAIQHDILDGTLGHAQGPVLSAHIITDETITLLGKLDQLSSGFVYQTTINPRLCDGCAHVVPCTNNAVRPYSTLCQIVKKEPDPIVWRSKNNARLERCKDLLETITADEANKVIVWARYHAELDDIESAVKELGLRYVRVQGGMGSDALKIALDAFNNDATYKVYIAQVSTGIGITLNSANYTIYYNLPWSLEQYLQSLDRNYRIGQNRKVTVYRLIGRYTLDETKALALDQKIDFSNLVTASSVCAMCPDYFVRCHKHKIALYSEACKYDRKMLRHTASVKVIP